jgi:C-terminal processing protease CtpA/Prc
MKWVGLTVLLLSLGVLALRPPLTPPDPPAMFAADIDLLDTLLHDMWANRQIHEQVDDLDVAGVIRQLRSRTANISSREAFAPILRDALVQLGDGHLNIVEAGPKTMYRSGLRFRETEVGVALTSVVAGQYATLDRGDLLVQVGDQTVEQYLATNRIRSGSTSYQRRRIALDLLSSQALYAGEQPAPNTLTVRHHDGVEQTIDLQWVTAPPGKIAHCVDGEMARPTIGVLRVHTFSCNGEAGDRDKQEFVRQLTEAARAIAGATDVVVDLRDNGGGWDEEGWWLLGLFVHDDIEWSRLRFTWPEERRSVGPPRPVLVSLRNFRSEPDLGNPRLSVLIGPACFSACDVAAHALRRYSSARFFGEPTGGGAGGPSVFTLPISRFTIRIPAIEVYVTGSDTDLVETHPVFPDRTILPRADASDTVLDDVLAELSRSGTH